MTQPLAGHAALRTEISIDRTQLSRVAFDKIRMTKRTQQQAKRVDAIREALRASSNAAVEQLIVEAEARHYTREQIVDRLLAIKVASARRLGIVSDEDLTEFAIQVSAYSGRI
jgi:hypothetical protein